MTRSDAPPILLHQDPVWFREAVTYTAAETGFSPRLIEKDYFCTVLLQHLARTECGIVFKGGTCLAKVHAGFYRLSEDLDFAISTPLDATRAERRRRAAKAKIAVDTIGDRLPGLRLITALAGTRDAIEFTAVVGYASRLARQEETVKIEIGLREPLLTPPFQGEARTLLCDPITGLPLVPVLTLPCLSRAESIAEKLRAALSRPTAAIRDYYDIDYVVRRLSLGVRQSTLVGLVKEKLVVNGLERVDVSPARLAALRRQLESRLKPVLRIRDFVEFDLDRAFASVAEVAAALTRKKRSRK